MPKDLKELKGRLHRELPALSKEFGVAELGVFGSWARGEQDAESDLDILVAFDRTPGLFRFVDLEDRLQQLLGVPVDLVMESALKPRIGERILAEVQRVGRA